MSAIYEQLSTAVLEGDAARAHQVTAKGIEEGLSPKGILDNGLIVGMNEVGVRFKRGDMFVPEVLMSAEAMQAGLAIIRPLLLAGGVKLIGKIVFGTVKGDLHDIGKNLVAMMMEGAGFEINDLGVDVKPEQFVEAVKSGSGVVALSALLTTTMPAMKDTIEALKAENVRDKAVVIIGGAPVTQNYADEIGADGYAPDAASAVDKAKELLKI